MSRIFEIGSAEEGLDFGLLELLFKEMTAMRGIDILETYVLLDAYLFSRIPRGFSEKSTDTRSVCDCIKEWRG